jgi:hypothetical protein
MLKCNSIRKIVSVSFIHKEWFAHKIVRETESQWSSYNINSNGSLVCITNKLYIVENEIIKENSGARALSVLDSILESAYRNFTIHTAKIKRKQQ